MIAQSIVMSCLQVGVAVVACRLFGPLDRAWAGEADEVPDRAGFVVGAGGSGSAEGLLADGGAGRLVVDVEVAGGVFEGGVGFGDGLLVGGEDGAGEAVDGGFVGEPEG